MITLRIKIVDYDKHVNYHKAELLNGDIVDVDLYVGCAITQSDEEYKKEKGFELIGKSYILTEYHVYVDQIVVMEDGLVEL